MAKLLIRLLYHLRVFGLTNLPKGGAVVVSNHMTYLDVVFLSLALRRKIRFIASDTLHKSNRFRWLLWMSKIELVPPTKTRSFFQKNIEHLKQGGLLGVFPEGQISNTGNLMALRPGFETIAREAGVPVVPVCMDNLWHTLFSSYRRREYRRKPISFSRTQVSVNVGHPIPPKKASVARVRQAMLDLGSYGFNQRPELKGHIGYYVFNSLASRPLREHIFDYTADRRVLKSGLVLALSLILARTVRREVKGKRVGIVMPPGIGGTLANLAVVFAGKVPVNLNFTAGPTAIESCYKRGKIDVCLTASALQKKIPNFPWPKKVIDVVDVLKATNKKSIILKFVQIILVPNFLLRLIYRIPKHGDKQEAGLLFTSGSDGEPKGVPLSHRNIMGNVLQIDAVDLLNKRDTTVMCCLPIFHSFGFTVTLWYTLIRGLRMVTLPSPLEPKKIANCIEAEKVTTLIGTRTFFKPYLRRVEPEKLATLDLVVAGAEKVTPELFGQWKDRFGSEIFEGYGLTETTPVVSVNLKDPKGIDREATPQVAYRRGAVGRMLPGLTARIKDPDTDEECSLFEPGMLYLKGANVFQGYLADPERNAAVLQDGWFRTGDIGRFDEDGFLYIEGRQSRFSKIGGEMVPHGTVEDKVVELYGLQEEETARVAITARFDDAKGEALVLLTTLEMDLSDLKQRLTAEGFPNLWIPRIVKSVEEIPVLASGKIDLKGCQALAALEDE